jgi:hypothetical protein
MFNRKSTKELVLEIHTEFYTEADRLIASALQKKEAVISNIPEYEKGKSLNELGFVNSESAVRFRETEGKRLQIEQENSVKDAERKTIEYFQQKYPNHKYINVDGVKRICAKYGLIFGSVENFKGNVPEKNLNEILKAQIPNEDACFYRSTFDIDYSSFSFSDFNRNIVARKENHPISFEQFNESNQCLNLHHISILGGRTEYLKAPLEIAAPIKDFDLSNMEVDGFEIRNKAIEIPDPVVLQPVFHNGKKHYLILTAWGDEANHELVVNQKMN